MNITAKLSRVVALSAGALLLSPAMAAIGGTHAIAMRQFRSPYAAAGDWGARLVVKPGDSSLLNGVSCSAAANCWAVGGYDKPAVGSADVALNQALHWNGRTWSRISAPNPGGTAKFDVSALDGIWCRARADCWAVGAYARSGRLSSSQVLHWNGSRWSRFATPEPGGAADTHFLTGIACVSARDCWAVGDYLNSSGELGLSQALHWNGSRWSRAATPDPAGAAMGDFNNLNAVWCVSARDCWAVGSATTRGGTLSTSLNQALRWNGRRWSSVPVPSPGGTAGGATSELTGLACVSGSNCWAVGDYDPPGSPGTALNQVLHWNGRRWSPVAAPDPDGTGTGAWNILSGIYCTSADNCWAVGRYGSIRGGIGSALNQALHWNGSRWSVIATPDPGGSANDDSNVLDAVSCSSASDCWAVGFRRQPGGGPPDVNQALHWNGRRWSAG